MRSENWRSRSSGKESYVLKMQSPQDLFGVHADLIERALLPGEKILYLIYVPIWDSAKALYTVPIFPVSLWEGEINLLGVHAYPASHGVAVIDHRFLISEDRRTKGILPSVRVIPFAQILRIDLGSDLIKGWFAIHIVDKGQWLSFAMLFTTTTGIGHFQSALNEYRQAIRKPQTNPHAGAIPWPEVWQKIPPLQRERLKPLILEDEQATDFIPTQEIWGQEKRGWRHVPVCWVSKSIFLSTNLGFLYAIEEPPMRPHMVSFGIDIALFPWERVRSALLIEKRVPETKLQFLRIEVHRGPVRAHFHIPFDESNRQAAEALAIRLGQERSLPKVGSAYHQKRKVDESKRSTEQRGDLQ